MHSPSPVTAYLFGLLLLISQSVWAQSDPPVVVAEVERQELMELLPVSGTVSSPRVSQLSTGVEGLVEAVMVESGDWVDQGTPLLRLDPALASWSLKAAQATTEQAREELADARRRLNDVQQLTRNRAIAETELKARQSEVRLDMATLKLRQAEQEEQQERLNRHLLKAPFAGVISRKLTEAGAWVGAGDPVLELFANRGLRIDLQVPQGYFPRIDADTPVTLRLDALGERPVKARIGEIVPVSDPSARTFLIRAYPEQDDLALTPGMSASAVLQLKTGDRSLVVSRDALLRHPDGRITAWVLESDAEGHRVSERLVQIGLAFDGRVAVKSGLNAGERVVVEGNEALQPGQSVRLHGER